MKDSYLIKEVVIDVVAHTVTIKDNGKDIPEQVYEFQDEDEWFGIKSHKGEFVMDGNIWWDEQWGFQYSEPEQLEDGTWQTGSDYQNPEKILFTNDDKRGFYEVEGSEDNLRMKEAEERYHNSKEFKTMRLQQVTSKLMTDIHRELEAKVNKMVNSGAVDLDSYDAKNDDMILPKAFMVAYLQDKVDEFGNNKLIKKEAKNIQLFI